MRKESFEVLSFFRRLLRKKNFIIEQLGLKRRIQLKIVKIAINLQGQPILQLQWIGQHHFFERTIDEILNQEQLLSALSQPDLKKMLQIKIATGCAPLQLVAHFNENNHEKIVYKNRFNHTFIKNITAARRKEFIRLFSPNDAYLIGYLLAWEDQRREGSIIKPNEH